MTVLPGFEALKGLSHFSGHFAKTGIYRADNAVILAVLALLAVLEIV